MMKPFSRPVARDDERKAIFNYRLCRARGVSENAFALLSQNFRIFYTTIHLSPDTVDNVIIVACCLHNLLGDAFLETANKPFHQVNNDTPTTQQFISLARRGGFVDAGEFYVMEYFNSAQGTVDGQITSVRRTD